MTLVFCCKILKHSIVECLTGASSAQSKKENTVKGIVIMICAAMFLGFLCLVGPGFVQEKTQAAVGLAPETEEVVEEVEQVDNSARMTCFAHLRDVQEQGATLNYDSCSIEDVQEYVDADGACKRHMLATGNVCGD